MCDIVNTWIQNRLGVVIDSESLSETTRDGLLLAKMLNSYGIINDDQLEMIQKSNTREICLGNFQNHIVNWLQMLGITLEEDELDEIIDAKGVSSVCLFYRVFLELNDKDNLHFLTQQRLNLELRPTSTKFTVTEVEDSPCEKIDPPLKKYGKPLNNSYDIVHWHQDRLESLVNKCRTAREEYTVMARARGKRISSNYSVEFSLDNQETRGVKVKNVSVKSLDQPYHELIEEQRKVLHSEKFAPNVQVSKKILKKIRLKQQKLAENAIFKSQLHKELLMSFWAEIEDEEENEFNAEVAEKLLKQSLYEKQMVCKIGEVKMQKEVMIQNKQIMTDAILKETEAAFVDKLLEKNEEFNAKDFQYYLEKERTLQLHRKIYQEKLRLKAEKNERICSAIMKDICNAALKECEYKELFGEEPTSRLRDNWKKIFVAGESYDDAVMPLENIIQESQPYDEEEDIIHKEIERQDKLDARDFESYTNFECPWELDSIDVDENILNDMKSGMNLLGYIVYSLLEAKYPKPLAPSPPDLSKFKASACINGLNEVSCLPLLQKMLNHQCIEVIEMQDAINFCVESFKNEIRVEDDDTPVEIKKRKSKVKKEVKSKKQLKSKSKQTDEKLDQELEKTELVDKIVQTPKSYPCEEIHLSPKAELGEIAYNELAAGRSLTDYLLVAMFIELLMSKQDIKGWVLINYPTTYEQAALLEEALTGLPIPGISNNLKMCKSIAEVADVNFENNRQGMYEENELLRRTSLLTNPAVKKDLPFYESALTAYIKIIPVNEETHKFELPLPQLENLCPLDRFYSDMGCNYSMYYRTFDFNAVKYLAKLIVGDYSIPPKSSVELLGDTIRYINADKADHNKSFDTAGIKLVKKGDKKEMERKEKVVRGKAGVEEATLDSAPEKTTKKGKQPGKKELAGHVIIVHADKFTQIPEVEIEEVDEEEDREPPKPGEPGWDYVRLKPPEKLQVALASLWENLEDVYKENFCQVLFSKRVILNAVVPFANYARECMKVMITKPDDKQMYLRKFQETYNAFDEDIRSDEEFKAELHCRVNEMREKLIGISDRKMMESEQERVTLIDKRWAPKQLVELINNYTNGFQLELDRCVDTLILINDYYCAIILKMAEEETLSKENLTKYDLDDQTIAERINNVLIKVEDNESMFLPQLVEEVSDKALAFVSKNYNLSCSVFEKVKALFSPQAGKERPKTPKKEKKSGKNEKNLLSIFEPSEEVKTQSEKIFGEWRCALEGETARVTVRLKLLKADLARSTGEIINTLKKTFHGLLADITSKYRTEVECVMKACSLLDRAIEEEVPIQEELVILGDRFCVDPESILFPDVIHPEPPFSEPAEDLRFTRSQLESMTAILFDLAPSGIIPERCFVFLLQDMIFNDDQVMAPKLWERLEPSDVEKLSGALFGQAEIVQWKEFIVYNLMVPFPNAAELLSLLRKFVEFDPELTEVVNEKQFFDTNFWFEDQSSVKRLLFNLYRVGEGKINYTAMLLDFCKDLSNPAGLAKALALSLDKAVCWDEEVGRKYADDALEKRRLHEQQVRIWDEERQERTAHATEILESIIDTTVHQCESIIIEDWPKPENANGGNNADVADDETKTVTNAKKSLRIAEDEQSKVEPEDTKRFSNVPIDFEENRNPSLMYFIPLDAVLDVLTSALPWHSKVERIEEKSFCEIIEDIYDKCKRTEFNSEVLSHEFLNDPKLLALLSSTTKFLVRNPPEIVHNLLRQYDDEK